MKNVTFLFAFFYVVFASAQKDTLNSNLQSYTVFEWRQLGTLNATSTGIRAIDNRYEGLKGTPFWKDEFKEAIVSLNVEGFPADKQSKVKANLNLVTHELTVQIPNGSETITLSCGQIGSVHFTDDSYAFIPESYKEFSAKKRPCGIAQVLYKGEQFQLFQAHNKLFKEASFQGAYSSDVRYDEYKLDSKFWLKSDGEELKKIKLSKKSLMKALPKFEKQITSIAKKDKLNLSTEEGMIQMLIALEGSAMQP